MCFVPPCSETRMSTLAPGSQLLLLGLTRYFSGAVVRTCKQNGKNICLDIVLNSQQSAGSSDVPAGLLATPHLKGHLIFGDVV